jgi:3-phosphoshikimate 1-carboxyvinyltransferase
MKIFSSNLCGSITLPSSKSQTLRALFFAAFANSVSKIIFPLECQDSLAMCSCLEKLGAKVEKKPNEWVIHPFSINDLPETISLHVSNSGITYRFMTAISLLLNRKVFIDGDQSIRENRPIKELLQSLESLGAKISFPTGKTVPFVIEGGLLFHQTSIYSSDSQPISALFYLGALSKKPFDLKFDGCQEKPWLDLSYQWLIDLKLPCIKTADQFTAKGHDGYLGFNYHVPGDLSALAFFLAISIIHKTPLTIHHVHLNDLQPDKIALEVFEQLGGSYTNIDPTTIQIYPPNSACGFTFDLEKGIDLLPIFSVLACFLSSKTTLYNGKIARAKESDRISAMAIELKKMGAKLEELEDGLIIYPSTLFGVRVNSHHDHRVAMSLFIAATKAKGITTLNGIESIQKTYPRFIETMKEIGAYCK